MTGHFNKSIWAAPFIGVQHLGGLVTRRQDTGNKRKTQNILSNQMPN